MAEEQTGTPVQDPGQVAQVPAPAEPAPQQYQSQSPWGQSLSAFDPETAAKVDQWAKENVQPYVTRQEQQYAETAQARDLYEAFQNDPEAANIAVNRQMYGDEYADQLAHALGRPDQATTQPVQQQQPQQVQQQPVQQQQPQYPPEIMALVAERQEAEQQKAYDQAKASFLTDPQYADIDSELFDPFIASADTWEEAANGYRAWAAAYAQKYGVQPQTPEAPNVIGSQAGGTVGTTPSQPNLSLDETIDEMFAVNRPVAPTVIGGQ